MNKSGFTLIELMIATFIASSLALLLFAALYQINRFVPIIDNRISIYERAAIVNAQFERDLSGVTAPNEFYARQKSAEKKTEPAENKSENEKKKSAQDKASKAKAETEEKVEEKPKKPLEKIFYSVNKDNMLNQLSFIITNPLQVYWSGKAGSAKPRVARVFYTLKEEKKGPQKSYSLIRQESDNLEFDSGKEALKEYVVADGIKAFNVEYTAVLQQEKGQEKEAKEETKTAEPKKKKEIKKMAEWTGKAEEATPAEKGKEKLPLVPQMVEISLAFWDMQKKRSTPFSFKIPIRSEIEEKRQESPALLEKLKSLVGQVFPDNAPPSQPPPPKFAQRSQPNFMKKQVRLW